MYINLRRIVNKVNLFLESH